MTAMSLLGTSATAQPFGGTYRGTIAGTAATLALQQEGTALRGTVDAEGYSYILTGTTANGGARGTLNDPQIGTSMPCEIALEGSTLRLILLAPGTQGQAQRISFSFTKSATSPASAQAPQTPAPQGQASSPEGQRDPALYGRWVKSETYTSGAFSGTTRTYLQFNPDGTMLYGGGDVTAGVGGVSGSSSGGDVTEGLWRTENNLLYARGSHTAWSLLGRYYIEGNRMLTTAADGTREVWHR